MSRLLIGLASIVLVARVGAMGLPDQAPAATPTLSSSPTGAPTSPLPIPSPPPTWEATPEPTTSRDFQQGSLLPVPSIALPTLPLPSGSPCLLPPACGRPPLALCLPVSVMPSCH